MTKPSGHIDTFCAEGLPPRDQWPDMASDMPEFQYPPRLNAATALLDDAIGRGWGDRPCIISDDEVWTYSDLLERSNRLANVLVDDFGIVGGNRILLRGGNSAQMVTAWFATVKAGAVAVATMPLLRKAELTKIYAKCSPALALCDAALPDELSDWAASPVAFWGSEGPGDLETRAESKPATFTNVDTATDDVVLLGFTSGTTGDAKATMHFHSDVLSIGSAFGPLLKADADDIFCGSPPLAFTFGLGGLVMFPMRVGAATAFTARPGVQALMETIEKHSCTVCFTAPTAYRAMLDLVDEHDISSLRRAVSAGETLPKATWEAMYEATGLRLIDGLGATELLHIFLASADDGIRPGATGKPLPGYTAKIVDDQGNELPDGEIGKLAVRGPTGCRYLNDDRQSTYVRDGWNLTGDAYIRDSDGYYHYQARTDDMIISSGYNIAAPEVEAALLTHPSVAEAGVIGQDDDQRGKIVSAFVHLREPQAATDELAAELQEHVKSSIAPYKYPRRLRFVPEPLPKTQTGKLQRFALHDL